MLKRKHSHHSDGGALEDDVNVNEQLPALKHLTERSRKRLPRVSLDQSMRQRQLTGLFQIRRNEFRDRVRFRDEQGNLYAVPRVGDELYKDYVAQNIIEKLARASDNARDEAPLSSKSMLLFLKYPRDKLLHAVPRGELQLLDLQTQYVYTCRIDFAMVQRTARSGHVIVHNLTRHERT